MIAKYIVSSLASLITLHLISANSYCNITCKKTNELHTMCQHDTEEVSQNCGHVDVASLSEEEEDELLRIHNDHRAFVASGKESRGSHGPQPGGNIPDLVWDRELATIAQRWANQCNMQHDKCRDVDRFAVNQNIAWKKWSDDYHIDFKELVQKWYNEVANFNRNFVVKYQSNRTTVTTHYSQLVWAATTQIGCGLIKYRENGGKFCALLVCNYGPMGNMRGQRMY